MDDAIFSLERNTPQDITSIGSSRQAPKAAKAE